MFLKVINTLNMLLNELKCFVKGKLIFQYVPVLKMALILIFVVTHNLVFRIEMALLWLLNVGKKNEILLVTSSKPIEKERGGSIAQWIRLRLPSICHGFES